MTSELDASSEIKAWLDSMPEGEPLTDEELMLATPYTDTAKWERNLETHLLTGRFNIKPNGLQGPPGMKDCIAARLRAEGKTLWADQVGK